MGKKYIVEIGRLERLYKAYVNENGKPNLTWLSPEVDLTPYTEPDFEQVRKDYDAFYEQGLADAWEAASEIAVIPYDEVEKIFGATGWHIFMKCTASEVIEKIKAREEKKQEEIKVGDEVTAEHGGSTFTVTWMSDRCICGIDSDGRCYSYMVDEVDGKTGNHHEIAAVLEKMRGEQDG